MEQIFGSSANELPQTEEDGVDHINVWSRGATTLGRLLSNLAHTPFHHPTDGFFASAEAYWYWLASGRSHQYLRRLYGASAKSAGSKLETVPMPEEEFADQIKTAVRCKIEQNSILLEAFISSTLPFRHYFVYGRQGEVRIEKEKHKWQMEYLTQLREELKNRSGAAEL